MNPDRVHSVLHRQAPLLMSYEPYDNLMMSTSMPPMMMDTPSPLAPMTAVGTMISTPPPTSLMCPAYINLASTRNLSPPGQNTYCFYSAQTPSLHALQCPELLGYEFVARSGTVIGTDPSWATTSCSYKLGQPATPSPGLLGYL